MPPRRVFMLATLATCGSAARYYLCAFQCPGCNASWASCRPEPCDAALDEDGCADGAEPSRLQLSDALLGGARAAAAGGSEEGDGAIEAHASRMAELAPLLRRNGTEAHLPGPAACVRMLPPELRPAPPSDADAARLGLPRGVPFFSAWGTHKERCAVSAKLALATERLLAEAAAAPGGVASALPAALCEAAMARARRGLRSMRSCYLGRREDALPSNGNGLVRAPRARRPGRAPSATAIRPIWGGEGGGGGGGGGGAAALRPNCPRRPQPPALSPLLCSLLPCLPRPAPAPAPRTCAASARSSPARSGLSRVSRCLRPRAPAAARLARAGTPQP